MRKFGAKLFTQNFIKQPDLARECVELVKNGTFDFLELMALPESFADTKDKIAQQVKGQMKVVIHAPHQGQGVNTCNPEAYQNNRRLLDSAQRFADLLDSDIIILHVGYGNREYGVDETIRQFRLIADERIAVENLPEYCPIDKMHFQGTTPQEIARIKDETGCKFCYDFCHGICASNSLARDKWQDVQDYANLNPDMYHLCDSDWQGTDDMHGHYGEGDYDLAKLLSFTRNDALITMETGHELPQDMSPWVNDVKYLRGLKVDKS